SQTPAARDALGSLAQSDDPALRMEVRMLWAPDDRGELLAALEASAAMRLAALRLLVRHNVRAAWPAVKRIYDKAGFQDLGSDERREVFRALIVLSSDHGEPLVIDLVKKGGVFRSESRETSRSIAAEVLGDYSRSQAVVTALKDVANSRWGVSEELR